MYHGRAEFQNLQTNVTDIISFTFQNIFSLCKHCLLYTYYWCT